MSQAAGDYRLIDTYSIHITPSQTEPVVQKYWAEKLKEVTKSYEDVLKDILRATGVIVSIIEDWAYSTKPTGVLVANYQEARKHLMSSISTALKLRDEIRKIVALHFPGKAVFTKQVPQIIVPGVEDLPPRIKLEEKIRDINTKLSNYVTLLLEKLQEVKLMVQEVAEEKKALQEKYKAKVIAIVRQYRDAAKAGDKLAMAQRLQELKALQADYRADLQKLILSALKKHREAVDDMVMLLAKIRELIQDYLDIVQPNDMKVYKGVIEQLYRAEEEFRKVDEVTGR